MRRPKEKPTNVTTDATPRGAEGTPRSHALRDARESFPRQSPFRGTFFQDSIRRLGDWSAVPATSIESLAIDFRRIYERFPIERSANESQTEDDLIWPVLRRLGWNSSLRQQNLAAHGREDVPDGILFKDESAKAAANRFSEEWRQYELGLAVVESKDGNARSIDDQADAAKKRPHRHRCCAIYVALTT